MNKYKILIKQLAEVIAVDDAGNVYDIRHDIPVMLKPCMSDHGYLAISVHRFRGWITNIYPMKIHRLVAYIKYGNAALRKGIDTRHLNGDKLDNSWDNIAIGTRSDNMQDMPKELRMRISMQCKQGIHDYYANMDDATIEYIHEERSKRAKLEWSQGKLGRKHYK